MSEIESDGTDDARSTDDGSTDAGSDHQQRPRVCRETVDPETRLEMLDEYRHRCQACGRRSPDRGGLATLHVHHIERDPDGMDEHAQENLTVLCRSCHTWLHKQSTPDDAPVELTEADETELLPQDIGVLRYLAQNGPARTGDIAAGLGTDLSVAAVRERLWVLMGLDNLVESRDQRVVDKDVETGEWGLVEQVENSARGHIPDDPQLLLQRMEDEQVRRALDRGCDRSDIMAVLDISRRTTFNKHKRACAYDFPLTAFGSGGPSPDDTQSEESASSTDTAGGSDDGQQRLDAVGEPSPASGGDPGTPAGPDVNADQGGRAASGAPGSSGDSAGGSGEPLREPLRTAIDALNEVENRL